MIRLAGKTGVGRVGTPGGDKLHRIADAAVANGHCQTEYEADYCSKSNRRRWAQGLAHDAHEHENVLTPCEEAHPFAHMGQARSGPPGYGLGQPHHQQSANDRQESPAAHEETAALPGFQPAYGALY